MFFVIPGEFEKKWNRKTCGDNEKAINEQSRK